MTLKYQVVIWWSERDGCFLAMAPQLPRCIADGETPKAALAAVQEAMELWLELAHEEGWPIPEPPGALLPVQNEFHWCAVSKAPASQPKVKAASKPATKPTLKPLRPKTKLPRGKSRKTHVETTHAV